MIRRTFVVLVFVASLFVISSTQNTYDQGRLYGYDLAPDLPQVRERKPAIVDEEEDRYVPVAFNIDDGPSNGNGFHNGHAIEMLAPVEVPEYGWNGSSRGVSELDHGGPGAPVEFRRSSAGTSQELADRSTGGDLIQCGHLQIDPRYAVCCDGLVYQKTSSQDAGKCCGSVAYDDRHFTCCQGRAIVRRTHQLPLCCGDYTRDTLPDQCRAGYQSAAAPGSGSTCCRSAETGAWKCCVREDRCCDRDSAAGGTVVDVPGFRPACCRLANEALTAQCCATTYEKLRVLPDCCRGARLTPVCCRKRYSAAVKCCPGTDGYCCGTGEIETRVTDFPPTDGRHSAGPPIQPPRVTLPPRPSHTDRPTRYPFITYPPESITGPVPRLTHTPFPRYVTRFPDTAYSPAVPGVPRPSCCRSKTPQRPCCSKTRGQQCCRSSSSSLSSSSSVQSSSQPRCCFIIYFNVTCCREQRQQQQQMQPQAGSHHGGGSGGGGGVQRHPVEVHPVNQPTQTNGHHQTGQHHGLNGRHTDDQGGQRGSVALSCCGLDSSAAVVCCREGHQETGRLPSCCISSPSRPSDARHVQSDSARDIQSDDPHQPSATRDHQQQQQQQQQGDESGAQVQRCNGVAFDAEEHICCGDRLRQRIGVRPACCVGVAYDSLLYKCCDGNIRLSCRPDYKPKKSLWGVHI